MLKMKSPWEFAFLPSLLSTGTYHSPTQLERGVSVFNVRDLADVRAINAVVVLVNYELGNVSTLSPC